MGSIAREERCGKFIKEFEADVVKLYGIKGDFVVLQELGTDGYLDQVFLYVTVLDSSGKRHCLCENTIFFSTEDMREDMIDNVVNLLNISEEEAIRRLKKAELI